ncbi:MAG: ABC transporter permease [Alphaproteobacteria bacterium]|nr:ABC transporter permease [Alphaproteobacteria bacterium]
MDSTLKTAPLPQSLKPPRFLSLRTITALILREMESTYGRQPGGYVWAVLQPIGMIVLLSLAFSFLVHKPALGKSFIFFYAISYLPFDLYSTLQGKISGALIYSRALLFYPRVTWIDAIIARFLLNTLTLVTVFCIVVTGIALMNETRSHLDLVPLILGLSMAACLGLGVGMMNCLLGGLFPVWDTIWNILSRPLFLASGVLFLPESMPRVVQYWLTWNPLTHVIGLVRKGFFPTYDGAFISLQYGYGFSLVLIVLAMIFLRAHYKTILQQ